MFPWFSLALIVICLLAGFIIGRVFPPAPVKLHAPPLSQKIHLVDLAVQSQFYVLGLSEKDIVSRESKARRSGKRHWTETTTTIQLPRPIPFPHLAGRLGREVETLGKDFTVVKTRDQGGVLALQVRIGDVVAHNLIFHEPRVVKPKIPPKGRVAIVIDDLGQDRGVVGDLLDLEVPLSFSIIPFTPHSREVAREVSRRGMDVLLHLPMEPKDYPEQDPGRGGLLTTMKKRQILSQLAKDLSDVPYARGVNNHMGSRFTEDPELMRYVLEDLQKRGLFFLDSRTTPRTVGFKIAQQLGLKAAERNVFLDNERDVVRIKARIEELIGLSLKNGGAIGIGHPYPETVQAIREAIPSLSENGVQLVPVSLLLE